ncbi:amidohydrolase family protein [Acidobacteriota bacterium]
MSERESFPENKTVIFFEWDALAMVTPTGIREKFGLEDLFKRVEGAKGIITHSRSGSRRELKSQLEELDLFGLFDNELIVVTDLLNKGPDHRAFKVAAAIADIPAGRCVFAGIDPGMLIAAAVAGMRTVTLPVQKTAAANFKTEKDSGKAKNQPIFKRRSAPLPVGKKEIGSLPQLMPRVIDEDIGPTYILQGRIVTMNEAGEVIEKGNVFVQQGIIEAVGPLDMPNPPAFLNAPVIETGGTIYPGMIDLHNHLAYNVFPLWKVPEKYGNRSQWQRSGEYAAEVKEPAKLVSRYAPTAKAIVRYVEAKSLIGGVTTGQDIKTRSGFRKGYFQGAIRNIEETDDDHLPEAGGTIMDLWMQPYKIENFRRQLENRKTYFYHLSEGVDAGSRQHFLNLMNNELVAESLVAIHALGLLPDDYKFMADKNSKIVWSPFSNILLYGKTINLKALLDSGASFSIGCDWAPSGGKNLLQELKIAQIEALRQGVELSPERLVRAATSEAAKIISWHPYLGLIRPSALADMLVIPGTDDDPYEMLIQSNESEISLVTVHNIARYGDRVLMEKLHADPENPLESIEIGSIPKALHIQIPGSVLQDLTFQSAATTLTEAMVDLNAFKEKIGQKQARFRSLGLVRAEPFSIELDNEMDDETEYESLDMLIKTRSIRMTDSIRLDSPIIKTDNYWERIDAQKNIAEDLKKKLKEAYE